MYENKFIIWLYLIYMNRKYNNTGKDERSKTIERKDIFYFDHQFFKDVV